MTPADRRDRFVWTPADLVRRWTGRRHQDERTQLVEDVRRLAAFADVAVDTARKLGAEVPEGVEACPVVWRHWAARLFAWAHPDEP